VGNFVPTVIGIGSPKGLCLNWNPEISETHLFVKAGGRVRFPILLGFLDPTVWKGSASEPGENFAESRFNLEHDSPLNDPVWEVGRFPKFPLLSFSSGLIG